MTTIQTKLSWEPKAQTKYLTMIKKIPMFHREIAQRVVDKKAQLIARARGSGLVEESDIVEAFFSEVPKAFFSLMIRLLDEVGFDYEKYAERKEQK